LTTTLWKALLSPAGGLWLVLVALALAWLGLEAAAFLLRRQYRPIVLQHAGRTRWQEVPAPAGERRWRCRLPFYNPSAKGEQMLLGLRGRTGFICDTDHEFSGLTGEVRIRPVTYGRWETYFIGDVVEAGQTWYTDVEVVARGPQADLDHIRAGWVRIEWEPYGRWGHLSHSADLVLPVAKPAPVAQPQVRDGVALLPIPTHLLTDLDDIVEVVRTYAGAVARPGDVVVLAESVVAITQGRYRRVEDVHPGYWARRLCLFFDARSSLASPVGMQVLIDEHGLLRVVAAFLLGALAKLLLRQDGVFYMLAGEQARLIDDVTGTMAPMDRWIVLGPKDPRGVVERIRNATGLEAAIVDANDARRCFVLAVTDGVDATWGSRVFSANPHGNYDQQTPIVVMRPLAVQEPVTQGQAAAS
jgi:hypothetical protein